MSNDEWADLYGEWDAQREPSHGKNAKWCENCQCWVERIDMKIWTGDDRYHRLCPGCDADLVEPEIME